MSGISEPLVLSGPALSTAEGSKGGRLALPTALARLAARPRQEDTARAPVRIDLAGGWTDVHHFADREGGAVLNAAITHYVHGELDRAARRFRVIYTTDVPPGAGLGASAALNVVWLALVNASMGRRPAREELAEQAYRLEELLGVTGGKQDQCIAALGRQLLRFEGGSVQVDGCPQRRHAGGCCRSGCPR
jgi:D-glycero-alpha-D-manno-heptose-7-phosphate kinase